VGSFDPDAEFYDYIVNGLTTGTAYDFEMRAEAAVGAGSSTGILTATPAATVPVAPTGLSATAGSASGTMELSWTASADGGSPITDYAYKYVKYDNGWHGPNWSDLISTGSTSTSYTVTGLESGELYRFRVVAVNSVGSSRVSKVAQAEAP